MTALTGSSPCSSPRAAIINLYERYPDAAPLPNAGPFARLLVSLGSDDNAGRREDGHSSCRDPHPDLASATHNKPAAVERHRPKPANQNAALSEDGCDPPDAVCAKPAPDVDGDSPPADNVNPSPVGADAEDACSSPPAADAAGDAGATPASPVSPNMSPETPGAAPAGDARATGASGLLATVVPPGSAGSAHGTQDPAPAVAAEPNPSLAGTLLPVPEASGVAAPPSATPNASSPAPATATAGAPATAATVAAVMAADPAAMAGTTEPAPAAESAAAVGGQDADAAFVLPPAGSGDEGVDHGTTDPGSNPAATGGMLHAAPASRGGGRQSEPAPAPPALQLAEPLVRAARAGVRRVEIALEPAALGRVDVRLDFAGDGRMSALIVADSRAALDALRGDAQILAQALSEAGIDSAGIDFGLRHREPDGSAGGFAAAPGHRTTLPGATAGEAPPPPLAGTEEFTSGSAGRLDIRA